MEVECVRRWRGSAFAFALAHKGIFGFVEDASFLGATGTLQCSRANTVLLQEVAGHFPRQHSQVLLQNRHISPNPQLWAAFFKHC